MNLDKHRILVCGGRDYVHKWKVFEILDLFKGQVQFIIHGAARGADLLAREWALINSIEELPFKADWDRFGLAAGPIRNKKMLVEGHPDLVIAFPGGKGTANMITQAEKAGVTVMKIED